MQFWKKELELKSGLADCRVRQTGAMEGNYHLCYMLNNSSLGKNTKLLFLFVQYCTLSNYPLRHLTC